MKAVKEKSPYEFNDYRDYLNLRFLTHGATRGLRSQLALLTQTKPSFITQVLQKKMHLSLEHVPPTNKLLGHTVDESHIFTLLVLYGRAGTADLEKYFLEQIEEIRRKRSNYLDRIKTAESLSVNHQALYYSQWYFVSIHVLSSIPEFQTKAKLSERLKLPLPIVSSTLESLLAMGLVEFKGGKYMMSNKRIYLKKDSPWISQMHSQYRNRAIHSLTAPDGDDFHFSQSMSLSKPDFLELRRRVLGLMTEFEPMIAISKEEEGFVLGIDLFKMV